MLKTIDFRVTVANGSSNRVFLPAGLLRGLQVVSRSTDPQIAEMMHIALNDYDEDSKTQIYTDPCLMVGEITGYEKNWQCFLPQPIRLKGKTCLSFYNNSDSNSAMHIVAFYQD